MPITTGSEPKALAGGNRLEASPVDAMQFGTHQALRASSKHKKLVSGVLHLKKESVGHRSNPTAYATGKRAAFSRRPS